MQMYSQLSKRNDGWDNYADYCLKCRCGHWLQWLSDGARAYISSQSENVTSILRTFIRMTNIFTESGQKINFPSDWWVVKLDEHRYYQRLSGQGLKAVDFLALHEDYGLILIELKNYRGATIPSGLTETMEEKCTDTARIISVINRYLMRKLFYRIFFLRLKWYRVCDREWTFWAQAQECLDKDRVLRLLDVQR